MLPARERIVGWYHTGPRLREADIDINNLMARYCDNPLLVICEVQVRASRVGQVTVAVPPTHCTGCCGRFREHCCRQAASCMQHLPSLLLLPVQPKDMGLPVHAYLSRDEVREDGTQKSQKVFVNLPTEVGATEAEEIGVEHLLRDVKDAAISTLSSEVGCGDWQPPQAHMRLCMAML